MVYRRAHWKKAHLFCECTLNWKTNAKECWLLFAFFAQCCCYHKHLCFSMWLATSFSFPSLGIPAASFEQAFLLATERDDTMRQHTPIIMHQISQILTASLIYGQSCELSFVGFYFRIFLILDTFGRTSVVEDMAYRLCSLSCFEYVFSSWAFKKSQNVRWTVGNLLLCDYHTEHEIRGFHSLILISDKLWNLIFASSHF